MPALSHGWWKGWRVRSLSPLTSATEAADSTSDRSPGSLAAFAQTQIPLYQGPQGLRAGARVIAGLVGSSPLRFESTHFRLGVVAVQEFAERWDGHVTSDDGNQGRTDLFAGPGVTIPFSNDWSVSVDVRARVSFISKMGPTSTRWNLMQASATLPMRFTRERRSRLLRWPASGPSSISGQRGVRHARRWMPGISQLPHARLVNPQGKTVWEGSGAPEEIVRQIAAHRRAM
jgi:hypothetical protein